MNQRTPDDGQPIEDDVVPRPGLLYFVGRHLVAPLLRLIYRPKVIGTRNDLDEWSKLIDIGVVGLGN